MLPVFDKAFFKSKFAIQAFDFFVIVFVSLRLQHEGEIYDWLFHQLHSLHKPIFFVRTMVVCVFIVFILFITYFFFFFCEDQDLARQSMAKQKNYSTMSVSEKLHLQEEVRIVLKSEFNSLFISQNLYLLGIESEKMLER